jgi:hypothetical protein
MKLIINPVRTPHLSRIRPKPKEPKLCITLKNDLRRAYLREGEREREGERGGERGRDGKR